MKTHILNKLLVISAFLIMTSNLHAQVILEAEDAYISSGTVETEHAGYTGSGFVDTENQAGAYIEWFFNTTNSITGNLDFRYAMGKDEHRYTEIYVNDVFIDTIDFDYTGAFTTYIYKSVTAKLDSGLNRVKAVAVNPEGAANMDHLRIYADTTSLPYFHVTTSDDGNGSVTLEPALDSFRFGSTVTATATGNTGYMLLNWSGDLSGDANPLHFVVDTNLSLHADFTISIPAFPGAEGYAWNITGGRGGAVYQVTTLLDAGPGSLRNAIEQSGKRTIVFRVSGTIQLQSALRIQNGDVTIAGQTAPGDGICLAGYPLIADANNVIIRFLRVRMGDVTEQQADAFSCNGHRDIIIDHCSFSWSTDEVASFYSNTNFIFQWCIVSESLYNSIHEKGNHGYGGIWGGDKASFHHNLLAHNSSRNPRMNGARYEGGWNEQVDHRNNVIYNWGFNSAYGGEPSDIDGNKARYNIVNNYYKAGPATSAGGVSYRIFDPDEQTEVAGAGYSYFYVDGNYTEGYPDVSADNWDGGIQNVSESVIEEIKLEIPVPAQPITEMSALEAYGHVMAYSGCVLPNRDTLDERIIKETINGTAKYGDTYGGGGKGIIDSQDEVGGWPELNQTTPPTDTDGDGMPDDWETANGMNPGDASDRNDDNDSDGFSNLEEYLNELVSSFTYIISPVHLTATEEDGNITLSWNDICDNETGVLIERSDGGDYEQIATRGLNSTSYVDEIETPANYSYRIRNINTTDTSYYSNIASIHLVDGLEDLNNSDNLFTLYPNPVDKELRIKWHPGNQKPLEISLYSLSGEVIRQMNASQINPENNDLTIRMEELPRGIYYVSVKTDMGITTKKIVKL
jgi:hypothetical protein